MTKRVLKKWRASNEPKAAASSRLVKFQQNVFLARTVGDLPNELKGEFDKKKKDQIQGRAKSWRKQSSGKERIGIFKGPKP